MNENAMQNIGELSQHLGEIIFGTFFLLFGIVSSIIAILRRGKDNPILLWLAAWSGSYGIRLLIVSPPIEIFFPNIIQNVIPAFDVIISYLILVFALLSWMHLTQGRAQTFLKIMIAAAFVNAILGVGWYFITGNQQAFMLSNNLLAACTLIFFVAILSFKKLSDISLILPQRGILAAGTLLFVGEALYSNLSRLFGYQTYVITGWLGFAALLLALAYTAAKIIFSNERRLITMENEMETARQIQSSILPEKVPEITGLNIAASYYPMTSVAGDFYEFIMISKHEVGILVADVSGHGVPAALIASMIKIAMQSVTNSANNPGEVLELLNKILIDQLHGQFVTAAYLYINSEKSFARYSAAGHPPMLYWNSVREKVESIESNGLIIGIDSELDYPVYEFSFNKNDRFLIYTDGLIEIRNANEEEFGNHRLNELIQMNKNLNVKEFSKLLLNEIKLWQDKKTLQQDDITFIIVDNV